MQQVAEILDPHVTHSGLGRLEGYQEPPTYHRDRGRVALLMLLYRFNMADFGVTESDVPRLTDLRALERLRLQTVPSNRGSDLRLPDNNDYGDNHSYRQLAAA
jgi:hypothetical protein